MSPRYPLPWRLALLLLRDALRAGRRSFRADACTCTSQLSPPCRILYPQNIPSRGPALLVTNHYARPGFRAWWIALAISAALPMEAHWLMTDAWTFLGPLAPLSHWVLTRVAGVYGFTASPPMPPRPQDVEARARAVRQILGAARLPGAVIALAPEGCDHPGGMLGPLPPGAGRFIEQLSLHCQPLIPIGVYEEDESLCLCFGEPVTLPETRNSAAEARDASVSTQVMAALARQLPPHLGGAYGN